MRSIKIILFGSAAQGEMNSGTDLDIEFRRLKPGTTETREISADIVAN
ncbi:MAG: nucleotidyltransferase domain-containing protein [bacterium]